MKKFFAVLFLLCGMSFTANAQIGEGTWMIGGDIDLNFDPLDLTIAPDLGFFIKDNLAVGGEVSITKFDEGDVVFAFGPFARYYLDNGLFGELAYQYRNVTGSNHKTRLGIGYSAELTESVRIEPIANVNFIGSSVDIGIRVGIQAYIFE